jgi:hypothetical protein
VKIVHGNGSLEEEYALPMDAISNSFTGVSRDLVGHAAAFGSSTRVQGSGWFESPVELDFTGTVGFADPAKRLMAMEQHSRNMTSNSGVCGIFWTQGSTMLVSDPYLFVHYALVSSTVMRVHIGWCDENLHGSVNSADPGTDQLFFDFDTGLSDTTIYVTQKANDGSQARDDTGVAPTAANYWEIDYTGGEARMRLANANGAILFDKAYTTNLPDESTHLYPSIGLIPLETVSKVHRFYCADVYANTNKVAPFHSASLVNSCNPQLSRTYTVTLSGLTDGSIWEDWDDAPLTVEHDSGGNYWYTQPVGSPFIGLHLSWQSTEWKVNLSPTAAAGDLLTWTGSSDACTPTGDYGTHSACISNVGSDCSGLGTTSCIVSA